MKPITAATFEDKTEEDAVKTVLNGIAARSEPERQKWVTMVATTAISVLHGTYGEKFTAGSLAAATRSLNNPHESMPIQVEEIHTDKLQ